MILNNGFIFINKDYADVIQCESLPHCTSGLRDGESTVLSTRSCGDVQNPSSACAQLHRKITYI